MAGVYYLGEEPPKEGVYVEYPYPRPKEPPLKGKGKDIALILLGLGLVIGFVLMKGVGGERANAVIIKKVYIRTKRSSYEITFISHEPLIILVM